MKVLLVDDDVFLCDMYATKFMELGCSVVVAMKPQEALNIVRDDSFDVLITDVIMPGMTGIELIKTIKEQYPDAIKKFIILSNQSEASDMANAEQVAVDAYIVKAEMLPSEVVEKVHSIVDKNVSKKK